MYKALAAYAAALIEDSKRFAPGKLSGDIVWFIDKSGCKIYVYTENVVKISLFGALRVAQDAISNDARVYDTVDRRARQFAQMRYNKSLCDLDHDEARDVLLHVAKH